MIDTNYTKFSNIEKNNKHYCTENIDIYQAYYI